MPRISLLSVVRLKSGGRYMAVNGIDGPWADCAWFADGVRQSARFRIDDLEVVSALDADDALWREAFRAADHKRIG